MDKFILKSSRKKPGHCEANSSVEPFSDVANCSNNLKSGQKRKIEENTATIDDSNSDFGNIGVSSEKRKKTTKEEEEENHNNLENYKAKFIENADLTWQSLTGENLNCTHCILMKRQEADKLLKWCEDNIKYNSGELSKIRIMGKWHEIPRKQVAMGEPGLSYTFSGKTLAASPWIPEVKHIRDKLHDITGYNFNFVLINRYKDGDDHIGEHQDDERELVAKAPIASLTLGQARDFVFKHKDSRGKNATRKISTRKIELRHGMLLLMNYPTNTFWYHSLPKRKGCPGVRINMTFRVFHPQQFKKGS